MAVRRGVHHRKAGLGDQGAQDRDEEIAGDENDLAHRRSELGDDDLYRDVLALLRSENRPGDDHPWEQNGWKLVGPGQAVAEQITQGDIDEDREEQECQRPDDNPYRRPRDGAIHRVDKGGYGTAWSRTPV